MGDGRCPPPRVPCLLDISLSQIDQEGWSDAAWRTSVLKSSFNMHMHPNLRATNTTSQRTLTYLLFSLFPPPVTM